MSEPDFRDALPDGLAHRRGAGLNPGNRFEANRVHVRGEERDRQRAEREAEDAERRDAGMNKSGPKRVELTVVPDQTVRVINRVDRSSDVPFDWTLNPYRGCEHGCIYCFARPYHEYLGYSCGLDFETKIVAKFDAPELLKRELAKPSWKGEPIVMSAITDIYQPIEKKYELSRRCLEVLADCGQATSTMTKNTLVLRDLDLWQVLGHQNAGRVIVTLVTLDDELAGRLEPRASPPSARLRIIRELVKAKIPVGVNIAPVIPGLTDTEIPALLEAVADAGAKRVAWVLLRLPHQIKDLFLDWLDRNVHPDRARKVESLIRQARGGKLYQAGRRGDRVGRAEVERQRMRAESLLNHHSPRPHDRPSDDSVTKLVQSRPSRSHDRRRGDGHHADQIRRVFDVYTRRYGLNRDVRPMNTRAFTRPSMHGQLGLFNDA
ncbi:MAG: radical SAM protein [Planctomycetota bacterium]